MEIMTKLEAFRLEAGRYPTQQQGIDALVERPTIAPEPRRWRRQFRALPLDPWGHAFVYKNPGTKDPKTFEVLSKGKDGKLGTADDLSSQDRD